MKLKLSIGILIAVIATFCQIPISGKSQSSSAGARKLKAILFADTECPVTQSYMTEIKKISEKYPDKLQFEVVFPVYTATQKEINNFLKKYQVSFPGIPDKAHKIAIRYHAKIMPEVALLDQSGLVVYQGAIDNFYIELGKNRPKPTEFYLRNAIEATLNGNQIFVRRTEAVGCLIND